MISSGSAEPDTCRKKKKKASSQLTPEKAKAQRRQLTGPRSHSKIVELNTQTESNLIFTVPIM